MTQPKRDKMILDTKVYFKNNNYCSIIVEGVKGYAGRMKTKGEIYYQNHEGR